MSMESQHRLQEQGSSPSQTSTQGAQPTRQPEMTKEQREFLDKMNKLMFSVQELSFAVAILPPKLIEQYPELQELVESARNVVRSYYEIHKFIKKRSRSVKG